MFISKTHVQHKQTQCIDRIERERKKRCPQDINDEKKIKIKIKIKEKNEMKEELNRNLFQGSILVLISALAICFDSSIHIEWSPYGHHIASTLVETNRRSTTTVAATATNDGEQFNSIVSIAHPNTQT